MSDSDDPDRVQRSNRLMEEFRIAISTAELDELRLQRPVGGNKFSADLMEKKNGRPPVGIQGLILDAMDEGRLTVSQAEDLLIEVNAAIRGGQDGR